MYAVQNPMAGLPPVLSLASGNPTAAATYQGQLVTVNDNWWGTGEFVYARATAAIRGQGLCSLVGVFDTTLGKWRFDATEIANTANLGRPVVVAMGPQAINTYGWYATSGLVPVNSNASIAADTALGIAAAGQAGANTAGKQLLNARNAAPATTTVIKTGCVAYAGSNQLSVPNADGWFPGVYLSGTGIAANTTVLSISPDGLVVTLSAVTTALVNGPVTATYNNATIFYNVVHLNRVFAQGAIT